MHDHQKVALLTIDDQRIAGVTELERYAQIMGIQLQRVHASKQVTGAIRAAAHLDLIVVDTPGLTPNEHLGRARLKALLEDLHPTEVHLILSASTQGAVMRKTVDFFIPLGVSRLLFTKIDWAVDCGHLINLIMASHLPATYLADSPQVPEGLRPATAQALAGLIWAKYDAAEGQIMVNVVQQRQPSQQYFQFVANRNSDIFHDRDCQSVKRINSENMVAFKDAADAMRQNFKPCRMCCAELIVSKPLDRLARPRAASSRY